jgi:hypothetical protein
MGAGSNLTRSTQNFLPKHFSVKAEASATRNTFPLLGFAREHAPATTRKNARRPAQVVMLRHSDLVLQDAIRAACSNKYIHVSRVVLTINSDCFPKQH